MYKMFSYTLATVLVAMSMHCSGAAEEDSVQALVSRLETASVEDIVAVCGKLVDPTLRKEKDDTVERSALHGLALRGTENPKLKPRMAQAISQALKADITPDVKAFLLDQLRYVADPDTVVGVKAFLLDPVLSHQAVKILLTVKGQGAVAALREALPATEGVTRMGLIQALGEFGDAGSFEVLLPDAASSDKNTRLVALEALAQTGSVDAVPVLKKAMETGSAYDKARVSSAFLQLLRKLPAATAEKEAIAFAGDQGKSAPHITCAVLDMLQGASSEAATAFALAALGSDVARVRNSAIQTLATMPDDRVTKELQARLKDDVTMTKLAALQTLSRRKETTALGDIRHCLGDADAAVQAEAVKAMAGISGTQAVRELAWLTEKNDSLKGPVTETLASLDGKDVDAVLGSLLADAPSSVKPLLMDVLSRRVAVSQTGVLVPFLKSDDRATAVAAAKAMGRLGDTGDLKTVVSLLPQTSDKSVATALAEAAMVICRRMADREVALPIVLSAFSDGNVQTKVSLLKILPVIGSDGALKGAQAAVDDPESEVTNAAVRAIADWPRASAVPILELLVKTSEQPVHKVLAYRGYVRLLSEDGAYVKERLAHLDNAMAICPRPEERKLVLAAYGKSRDGAAYGRLRKYIGTELDSEAVAGIVELSNTVKDGVAVAALTEAMAKTKDSRSKDRAAAALKKISPHVGWIDHWQVAGPFMESNKGLKELHSVVFAPEKKGDTTVEWREETVARKHMLDLSKVVGGNNRAAYVRTNINVPENAKVILAVGSDDGLKAWLNGNVIHENNVPRAYVEGEDKVPMTLLKGENTLLLKITQGGGGWSVGARINGADGLPVSGMGFHFGAPMSRESAVNESDTQALQVAGKSIVLFNGKDLHNWMSGSGGAPSAGWQIQDGCLVRADKAGYIWTKDRFSDFVLELDFNTEGNSGLFFRTDNPKDPVQTGFEMQVNKHDTTGKHGVGAIYDAMAPVKNAAKPGWNHVQLRVEGPTIRVVLNGEKIVDLNLDEWDTPGQNPDGSKNKFKRALKDYKREGHIGFQDHGARVMVRNITIRQLSAASAQQ